MELFTINRYDETAASHDPLKEDAILEKLLRKAEKRKRKLEKKEKSLSISLEKETADDGEGAGEPMIKVRTESGEEVADESESHGENDAKPLPQTKDVQFQVLGTDVFEKKKEVQMVLPPWLAHPTIIANQISAEAEPDELLENLHYISPQLKQNLKFMKIAKLFPVQKEVIPWLLTAHGKPAPFRPRDICVSAPTGSGKTLAFAVPIVQLLSKRVERKIRALVVLPVTELALQVYKVFKQLVQNSSLTVCLFSKSVPFSNEQKLLIDEFKGNYYPKADIVITTPGRLVEHLHATKGFCLKSLRFLVIDEADRIMEQLHHNWLYHLDAHVKATSDMFMSGRSAPLCLNDLENESLLQPHKMLFSATLSQDPEKLQNLRLFQPKLFTSVVKSSEELRQHLSESLAAKNNEQDVRGEFVGKYTTPSELTERMCLTEMRLKPLTLYSLILENDWKRFLCFTNSTESANRLAFVLQKLLPGNYKIADLSSAIKPKMRKSVLGGFDSGHFQGLVCSDALSRGIDIENVDVVISYDVPRHIKTYIHRVGRTARAGRQGTAVTILAAHELDNFNKLLSAANKDELPEIKSNADLEETNAKIYAKILNDLQVKVEHDRNIKTIRKKHEKKRSLLTKNQDLGIMDRLQDEISHKMEEKASKVVLEIRKERRLKTVRKEKQKLKKLSADNNKLVDNSVTDKKQKKKLKRLQ